MKNIFFKSTSMLCFVLILISCGNNTVKTISLNKTTDAMILGQIDSLVANMTVTGDISKLPKTWSSGNVAVATVKDGVITAITAGNTTISVQAGDKLATCELTVSDKIAPIISHGDLYYYGDAYGTKKDSLLNNESNNFVIYLGSPLVNINTYLSGTEDRVMLELNTDTLSKASIPSGTYDMMTKLAQDKLLPFTMVPAYVFANYPWGSWYFGKTNNDIIVGNVVILNTNNVYDITYNLIDYYGNTISGTYHGTLNYTNSAQATPAQKTKSRFMKHNSTQFIKRN